MPAFSTSPLQLYTLKKNDAYELIDTGNGRKLERFGAFTVDRPEPQAMWAAQFDQGTWDAADGVFTGEEDADQGRWRINKPGLEEWSMTVLGATVICRFTPFRHMGIFAEQTPHWMWMQDALKAQSQKAKPRLLNLFAYTGAASLIAAQAGAEVTHVDASKKAITWAKQNQAKSELAETNIRWITEDVRKFVAREVRRGKQYDGILIDPPKFGRGPEGEVWDFFSDLPDLLGACKALLEPSTGFLILTSYAIRASYLAIDGLMRETFLDAGHIESGELAVEESSGRRTLSAALFARWQGPDLKVPSR